MLSGIGSADHLNSLGIKLVLDQPVVGQNRTDNLQVASPSLSTACSYLSCASCRHHPLWKPIDVDHHCFCPKRRWNCLAKHLLGLSMECQVFVIPSVRFWVFVRLVSIYYILTMTQLCCLHGYTGVKIQNNRLGIKEL